MNDHKQAAMLLRMANKDLAALQGMNDSEVFAEEIFGFHAQQAAEKAIKAWLALLGIEYAKTHDISFLLAELKQSGVDVDTFMELIEYNVFAVQFRYEAYDDGMDTLDRVSRLILHVQGVAESLT
ncbi:MAG: HEPN domain-containing protein [Mariprofundaceae bacterium]|nr:HEPN domain-containing protein [Mariprofundaceae bacterium]